MFPAQSKFEVDRSSCGAPHKRPMSWLESKRRVGQPRHASGSTRRALHPDKLSLKRLIAHGNHVRDFRTTGAGSDRVRLVKSDERQVDFQTLAPNNAPILGASCRTT
jgi:hypothetical protein